MTPELRIALTRLVELAEYEISCPACPNPPEGFHSGLREATQVTRQFLAEIRPPAGRYFFSAKKGGRGRQPRQNLIVEME